MAYNQKRALRMQSLSVSELKKIFLAKTLRRAAARYELLRRGIPLPKEE